MENLKQKLEAAPEEKVLDFESLDRNQVEALKQEIQRHNGLIRVFIHADWFTDEYEKRIKNPIIRTLKSKNSPPLLFFEDTRYFRDVKKVFDLLDRDTHFLAKPVYLVKTLARLPYPIMQGQELPPENKESSHVSQDNLVYGRKSLGRFIFLLSTLGVKKVLVGGNELIIDEDGDINKCVGNFVEVFDLMKEIRKEHPEMPDIEVKVSEMTGPLNRSDLRGVRDDLL